MIVISATNAPPYIVHQLNDGPDIMDEVRFDNTAHADKGHVGTNNMTPPTKKASDSHGAEIPAMSSAVYLAFPRKDGESKV